MTGVRTYSYGLRFSARERQFKKVWECGQAMVQDGAEVPVLNSCLAFLEAAS